MINYRKSKGTLIASLIFGVIIQPDVITQFRILFLLFSVVDLLIFGYFFYKLISNKSIPKYLLLWLSIQSYLLIVMLITGHTSDLDKWGRITIVVSDAFLVTHYYCKNNKAKELIYGMTYLGLVYLSVNAASIALFPGGIVTTLWGSYFFLGTRNTLVQYLFPFLVTSGLLYMYHNRKAYFFITIGLSLLNVVYFDIMSTFFTSANKILNVSGSPNSFNTCRHTPHGAQSGKSLRLSIPPTTAIALKS